MTSDAGFFCLKFGKRTGLTFALVALTAGCGDGGGGAPAAAADSGQSQGPPDSGQPPGTGSGEPPGTSSGEPGTTDSGEPPGAGDPDGGQGGAGSTEPPSETGSGAVDLGISGSPPAEVLVGTPLRFKPAVYNPGRHPLSFSAVNLPPWASIDISTGEIAGTPAAADVGTYTGIRVTVTAAGTSRTSSSYTIEVVATASGSVTLNWNPPTQNADGTPLINLAGFRIRYGLSPDTLTRSVTIGNPGVTSVVIENLTAAIWHFAATAYNAEGVESGISNVVSFEIM